MLYFYTYSKFQGGIMEFKEKVANFLGLRGKPEQSPLAVETEVLQLFDAKIWAESVLKQREALYDKIGTGAVQYDPTAIETLPKAVKIGRTKETVTRSIERVRTHAASLHEQLLGLITKENSGFIINNLWEHATDPLITLESHAKNGHIPSEDIEQFKKQVAKNLHPFIEKAIEIGSEDSNVHWSMFYISTWESPSPKEFTDEERKYLKKILELEPEDPVALLSFGISFTKHNHFSRFEEISLENVIETWVTLKIIIEKDPKVIENIKDFVVPPFNPEFIQPEIERLTNLVEERDKHRRLEEFRRSQEAEKDNDNQQ